MGMNVLPTEVAPEEEDPTERGEPEPQPEPEPEHDVFDELIAAGESTGAETTSQTPPAAPPQTAPVRRLALEHSIAHRLQTHRAVVLSITCPRHTWVFDKAPFNEF